MKLANICSLLKIIERHDEWNVLDMKMMMFAENVNKPFAHIAVDATLDWIINGGNTTLYLKEDVEKPF